MGPADELAAAIAARWPGSTVDAARLTTAPALDGDHRDDVVLAWACAAGCRAAIDELETHALGPALDARVRRLAGDALDDIGQLARVRLLTGDPPGITSYRGRGSLAAFVRTTAMRLAIDHSRTARRDEADDMLDELVAHASADPELAHMRERYAVDLAAALRVAWDGLAPHDRFVLELELHQRLAIDQIARVYGVHRTSATRRVASARAALVGGVRAALRAKLGITEATLDSILRLMTTSRRWSALAPIVEGR